MYDALLKVGNTAKSNEESDLHFTTLIEYCGIYYQIFYKRIYILSSVLSFPSVNHQPILLAVCRACVHY